MAVSHRITATVSLAALIAGGVPAPADSATCTWIGGIGAYGTGGNWSCGTAPGSIDDVFIDGGDAFDSVVTLSGAQAAGTLAISTGDELRTVSGNLTIHNSAVTNNGMITIGTNSSFRALAGSSMMISGTGTIVLDNSSGFAQFLNTASTTTIGSGQTVRGRGQIGVNAAIIVNNGLISADVSGATITLDVSGGNAGIVGGVGSGSAAMLNNGIMGAGNGGTLVINGGRYEQGAGGVIRALAGSTVAIDSDARIVGGTLTSVGSGEITGISGTRYLDAITLSAGSNFRLASGDTQLFNSLTNNGTMTLGTNSRMFGSGATLAIDGTGTIVLNNSVGFAQLFGSGTVVTLGSGQTVRGQGQIGINLGVIVNNALISANVAGQTITLDAAAGNGGIVGGVGSGSAAMLNNAIMQASDGGILTIEGGRYEQGAGGTIRALAGSTVNLNSDARIVGGTLASVGSGEIFGSGGTRYLDSVALSGGSNLRVASGDTQLFNSFTNNGTVTLGTNSRILASGGPLVIDGTGTIVLNNMVGFTHFLGSGALTTLGSGQTVRGHGNIGLNFGIIIHNGLISADVGGRLILLDAAGGNAGLAGAGVGTGGNAAFLNSGILEARNGGVLVVGGGRYENSGVIRAMADSRVELDSDARIVGGTLTSVGTGEIAAAGGGTRYLDGVTLSSGSQYHHSSTVTVLGGTFTNNGTATIGVNSRIRSDGSPLIINGSGTIVLNDIAGFSYLLDTGGTTSFGSGQIVRGRGNIGLNNAIIVNNGLLSADVNGAALSLDVSGGNGGIAGGVGSGTAGMLNTHILQATNGGRLNIEGGRYEQEAGAIIQALEGSTVALNSDARIVGGTLVSVGTGTISASAGTRFLDGVTLAAGSQYGHASAITVLGETFTNNGIVTIGVNSRLRSAGSALSINGTGTIVLNDSAGFSYLLDTGGVTRFGSGQTVRGRGDMGLNAAVIINNGLISADVTGQSLNLDALGGTVGLGGTGVGTGNNAAFLNGGTIEARNGGNLALAGGLYENSSTGTFSASGGTFNMAAADARLFNLQAGGVLNGGRYRATEGTITLRATGIGSITTIGTGSVGTDTIVTLDGPASLLRVQLGGAITAIESSLTSVAQSGRLEILGGRDFSVVAPMLSNAGVVQLGGGAFTVATYDNSGETFGFGQIASAGPVANSGSIRAVGGTLTFAQAVQGASGSLVIESGATLVLGGTSTAGTLFNAGQLSLGTSTITVTSDYGSTAFGTGNGFDGRANVSGTGLILAASATQDLSGPDFAGGILDLGNIRVGEATSTGLTITNNGTLTTLRGAVQNSSAPGVTLGTPDWVIGPNGGSAVVTVNFAGGAAGDLTGQTLDVVNNFDNVANTSIGIIGAAYNKAAGTLSPNPISLGNVRVGDLASGVVTIANTAPLGEFSEGLRVVGTTPSANANASGVPLGIIAAGSSGMATVGLSTVLTGAQSGTVAFDFVTDGLGTSGLAPAAIAGGNVTINASVFALGNPVIADNLSFGNVLQGTTQTRSITVENRLLDGVLAAFQEGLNAQFGAVAGDIVSALGSISNLVAGGSDMTTLTVTLDTAAAGAKSGMVEILLQSNGDGTSGLGLFDLAAKTVSVFGTVETDGTVFRLAEAGLMPRDIDLGNRRVGDVAPSQLLTIRNLAAADGFSESLDASSGATTGRASVTGGPIALLAAGDSSQAISVSIDTSAAGANGSVRIDFASNGEGTSGLGITPLVSQTVTLGGGVYQIAMAADQPAALVLAARRVGDAAATADLVITNIAADTGGYTEALQADVAEGVSFLVNGGLHAMTAELAPGASEAVTISKHTGVSGSYAETVTIANSTIAVAGTGLGNLALASHSVTVEANVYEAAGVVASGTGVAFGAVRQGDTAPMVAITITNTATGALTDSLETSVATTPTGVSGSAPGALVAGQTGDVAFTLDTSSAGVVAGSGSLGFVSSNAEMDDLVLAPLALDFSGTVTDLAGAVLFKAGGTGSLSGSDLAYVLDLGSFAMGLGMASADLGVLNSVLSSAFSESLGGGFSGSDGDGFSFTSADFSDLTGGATSAGNVLTFDYSGLGIGLYSRVYSFNGFSRFAGLADLALAPIELTVKGRIVDGMGVVPEPGVWAQLIVGFGLIGGMFRRRRTAPVTNLAYTPSA